MKYQSKISIIIALNQNIKDKVRRQKILDNSQTVINLIDVMKRNSWFWIVKIHIASNQGTGQNEQTTILRL